MRWQAQPIPANHVQLTIDGTSVTVPQGTTIFDAARGHGISYPHSLPPAKMVKPRWVYAECA